MPSFVYKKAEGAKKIGAFNLTYKGIHVAIVKYIC